MPSGTEDTIQFRFRALPDAHLTAFQSRGINAWLSVWASNPDSLLTNNGPRNYDWDADPNTQPPRIDCA